MLTLYGLAEVLSRTGGKVRRQRKTCGIHRYDVANHASGCGPGEHVVSAPHALVKRPSPRVDRDPLLIACGIGPSDVEGRLVDSAVRAPIQVKTLIAEVDGHRAGPIGWPYAGPNRHWQLGASR